MALVDLTVAWEGDLLRHRPARSTRSLLDDTYLGQVDDNRWSKRGVRAYYFASDPGVIVAEYGRHIATDLPVGHIDRLERAVFRVSVKLDRVLLLTDPNVIAATGAAPIATWILDTAKTQAAAAFMQAQAPDLQGLVVPSVAMLDRPDRFNVVVFRDAIDLDTCFGTPVHMEDIVISASGA